MTRLLNLVRRILNFLIVHFIPIDRKKIVFCNFNGLGYGCNPKYIAEELLKQKLGYKLGWLVKRDAGVDLSEFPEGIEIIDYDSWSHLIHMARAKFWVFNTGSQNMELRKKKGQVYIQTGHGSFGIKKIGLDINNLSPRKIRLIKQDATMLDYFVSHSKFETWVYSRAFLYYDKVLEFGHPRNDIFFNPTSGVKARVFKKYQLGEETKTLLYMPSFRSDGRLDCYQIDYDLLVKSLTERFSGDWKILVRFHPRTRKLVTDMLAPHRKHVVDVTYYGDIQELLACADVAITDFSSCIFDFMLQKKPAFIFATDIDSFNAEQGLYFTMDKTPFPVCRSNHELSEEIKRFDAEKYVEQIDTFLNNKVSFENGTASSKVVAHIQRLAEQAT